MKITKKEKDIYDRTIFWFGKYSRLTISQNRETISFTKGSRSFRKDGPAAIYTNRNGLNEIFWFTGNNLYAVEEETYWNN
ncbi:MAG: hypothetical protein AABY22_01245 [Nanoarchaeota archaeon]